MGSRQSIWYKISTFKRYIERILWILCYWKRIILKFYTVVEKSPLYFVLLYYSHKSWFIFKTRDRFEICWSWHFQNTPYMYNLTKFWLRYLRLKTQDTILLFSLELIWEDEKKQKSEQFVSKIVLFNTKGTNMNKNDL